MARKRMIDPEFFLDEDLAKLSAHARLLYIATWSIADDNYHSFPNRPEWIRAQTLPYENIDINALLKELVKAEKLIQFDHDGKSWFYIKNFGKYQRVERPSAPRYPQYPGALTEDSVSTPSEEKRSKEKRSKEKRSKDIYPDDFEKFWKLYPKKVGKPKASEFWKKLTDQEKKLVMKDVPERMQDEKWVGGFIKDPERYIKYRQWEDEIRAKISKVKVDTF